MSDFIHTFVCASLTFYKEKHSDCRRFKYSNRPVNKNSSVFACMCERSCLPSVTELFQFFTRAWLGDQNNHSFMFTLGTGVEYTSLVDCRYSHSGVAPLNASWCIYFFGPVTITEPRLAKCRRGKKQFPFYFIFYIYISDKCVFVFLPLYRIKNILWLQQNRRQKEVSLWHSHVLMNKSAAEPSRDKRRSMADTIDENEYFREYIYIYDFGLVR